MQLGQLSQGELGWINLVGAVTKLQQSYPVGAPGYLSSDTYVHTLNCHTYMHQGHLTPRNSGGTNAASTFTSLMQSCPVRDPR